VRIASWNVNSIRARLANLLAWLGEARPDIVLLQETKIVDEGFPREPFEELGYNLALHGQKSYNGVAILSKYPLSDVRRGLDGDEADDQARFIEAWVEAEGQGLRVASLYLPNGNPPDGPKFAYKLAWMERLAGRARAALACEEPMLLGGDYNVIPADDDCADPAAWAGDALARPEARARLRILLNLGLTEAWRVLHDETHVYTYWDYQARAFERDAGVRIDHLLLTPQAADRLVRCDIDRDARAKARASDHAPVWCELSPEP